MKKLLRFLVLLGLLLSTGRLNPQIEAAWRRQRSSADEIAPVQNIAGHGVTLAMREQQATAEAVDLAAQMDRLYPQDINPPESCHVPRIAPLGQDVEIMLGPWGGSKALLALNQPSVWNGEADLSEVMASTNPDVIALNTEELVAAWSDLNGKIKYATWGAG